MWRLWTGQGLLDPLSGLSGLGRGQRQAGPPLHGGHGDLFMPCPQGKRGQGERKEKEEDRVKRT